MATILSISYDGSLLLTRQLLLQQMGHEVFSAEGFSKAYSLCETHGRRFDLIALGHSIPARRQGRNYQAALAAVLVRFWRCCVQERLQYLERRDRSIHQIPRRSWPPLTKS